MSTYTLDQLADPQTYKSDKKLFGLARAIAEAKYSDRAQWMAYKDEITSGQHPQAVFDYIAAKAAAERAADEAATKALFAKNAKIETALSKLAKQIPAGVAVDVTETGLILKAPWDGGDLAERLKRVDARWNREQKHFDIPLDAVPSLGRILTNWKKAQDERNTVKAEQERQAAIKRQKEQAAREAQWAEEKRQRDAYYAEQRKQQARAVAQRVQVEVGQYKIGDILEGKPITGFGKSWEEGTLAAGQLWQECDYGRCENEPVCVNCFKCSKHCSCDTKEYCYAYFG